MLRMSRYAPPEFPFIRDALEISRPCRSRRFIEAIEMTRRYCPPLYAKLRKLLTYFFHRISFQARKKGAHRFACHRFGRREDRCSASKIGNAYRVDDKVPRRARSILPPGVRDALSVCAFHGVFQIDANVCKRWLGS